MSINESENWKDRVASELDELNGRISRLLKFIHKGKPDVISDDQWMLLREQSEVMHEYARILEMRLADDS